VLKVIPVKSRLFFITRIFSPTLLTPEMLQQFLSDALGTWGRMALLALVLLLSMVLIDGFRRLSGGEPIPRPREHGQTDEAWLMGSAQAARSTLGLPGTLIRTSFSSAAVQEWEASETYSPPLVSDGVSHIYGWLGHSLTSFLFRDVTIRPSPVEIQASAAAVWAVLIDFERYGEWNPFHRKVEIVTQPRPDGDTAAVRMTVAMGGLLGTIISTETIYYCDPKRHILAYGIGRDGPTSLRVVWLTPGGIHGTTMFHSCAPRSRKNTLCVASDCFAIPTTEAPWAHSLFFRISAATDDMIGGYPALLSRGHIVGLVLRGFSAQHLAIRERVHRLEKEKHGM